jgi:hypothetical protein
MKRIIAVFFAALAGGCASVPQGEEASWFEAQPGSTLTLHREVVVPAYTARAYIQNGRLEPFPEINRYHPHCTLETWAVKGEPRTIKPGEFAIEKVRRGIGQGVDRGGFRKVRLRFVDDGAPSPELWATEFFLRSPAQPDVYRLTCQHLEDPSMLPRYLTLGEIRRTLGGLMTLTLVGV